MIEPDEPKTIRFHAGDVPELPEIDRQTEEQERMECERRSEENLRWLQQNMGFEPFGGVW